jgi:adenylate cyclase
MIESERKFKLQFLPSGLQSVEIKQAYLMLAEGKQLRVRITQSTHDIKSYLCYKANVEGSATDKHEYEYQIPNEDALELFNATNIRLTKTRYSTEYKDCHVDIDLYPNGLQVVEIETSEGIELTDLPDYCGEELTGLHEYSNIKLALLNAGIKP